jgi:uncharacterized membrane protein YczE
MVGFGSGRLFSIRHNDGLVYFCYKHHGSSFVDPGFGTLSNIAIIATAIQIGVSIFPAQSNFLVAVATCLIGIAMVGFGSALYITCGLGPGPRDGLMTALHHTTGVRIGRVRLAIEGSVLVAGWLLGGTVGLGTLLFALLIGQSIAISLGVVSRITHR